MNFFDKLDAVMKQDFGGRGLLGSLPPSPLSLAAKELFCDLLRSRNNMETQIFQGALKMYARRKDKDLRNLMRYAGMFRVEKILRQYLEVLL